MHHGEVYRYLFRLTRRASDADDLAQETFLRAYRAWEALPPNANVRAWLFAIATNLCRNHFRSEGRRRRTQGASRAVRSEIDHDGPDEATQFSEARAAVEATVDRLPLRRRLAFILRKIHEFEYDVIGDTLGCSPESARAHVFQAVRKIRRRLGELGRGPTERPALTSQRPTAIEGKTRG